MKRLIFLSLCAVFLASCSQTKFVPNGSYLLNNVDLKVDNKKVSKNALIGVLQQKPVKKFLGVPFGLWVFNLSDSTGKSGLKRWLNKTFQRIGESPVLFDSSLYFSSLKGLSMYLHSKGYYDAVVEDSLIYRRSKFVGIRIRIKTQSPYRLGDYKISGSDTVLVGLVKKDSSTTLLKRGMILDSDVLDKERESIALSLKNKGYYYFNKSHIVYEADSAVGDKRVLLNLIIKNSPSNNLEIDDDRGLLHEKYIVKEVNVYTNYEPTEALINKEYLTKINSYVYNEVNIKYFNTRNVTSELVSRAVKIRPNEPYNFFNANATYENFAGLRIFRTINVEFQEVEGEVLSKSHNSGIVKFIKPKELICNIFLSPMLKQSYKVEGELFLSSQTWGVEGSLGYSHLNLLKGAENLNLNFNGSIDFLKGNQSENVVSQVNKSTEFGVSATLFIPRFLMPFNFQKRLKLLAPKTQFTGSYNFQSRTFYTRNLVNFGFGYRWTTKKKFTISYMPINLSVIKMYNDDSLQRYLKDNPLLSTAFSNHFISSGIISVEYNTQKINNLDSYFYSILNIEAAGNFVSLFNPMLKKTTLSDGKSVKSIWGMPYSQFIGIDYTVVYNQRLDSKNRLAYRFQIGAAFPYGNISSLPYEKYFYVGGANSMRGWQVRTLGPGASVDKMLALGDFKLEANIEYRYKLFWSFEGALFLDAGNVWFLPRSHQSSNATFKVDSFLSQIATNTGVGLRLNLGYLIARFDVGVRMVDPSKSYGSRFLLNKLPTNEVFSYHIGIGYPF